MKKGIALLMVLGVILLLAGSAGAQGTLRSQTLLPGALIPKFVDPLPVGVAPGDPTGIAVVDATAVDTTGPGAPGNTTPAGYASYNIRMYEFQAQILPSSGVPANPALLPGFNGLAANTGSWVWGYLTDADVASLPATPGPWRASFLGPVVLAKRGVEARPTYYNELPAGLLSNVQDLLPVDQTLDWADPAGLTGTFGCVLNPVTGTYDNPYCVTIWEGAQPAVPHIHGGEVAPAYDGGPDAWWTPGASDFGLGFPGTVGNPAVEFVYPNAQQAGTIWFHDHALGITRLNVYAGMAGVYPIIDPPPYDAQNGLGNEPPQAGTAACIHPANPFGGCLPVFPNYDIPLIIQDRSFDQQGQIFYNLASNPQPNINVHPYWIPEFIGDTIVVNGKTWPFLAVEPRWYRFRLVNGSNARFYDLTLNYPTATTNRGGKTKITNTILPFTVIATDDGYLNAPVQNVLNLIIGPGERYEILVNFNQFQQSAGNPPLITMMNAARTPFPGGAAPVAGTTDTVMQFQVSIPKNTTIADMANLPANLRPNNPIINIATPAWNNRNAINPATGLCPGIPLTGTSQTVVRQLTLNEVIGPGGPLELVLNNTKFNGVITNFGNRESEIPAVGDTEIWEIINITADAHPIHTHLASFQLLNRQGFRAAAWTNAYAAALALAFPGVNPDGLGPPLNYLTRNADCAIGGNPAIGPYLQTNKITLPLPYEVGWKDTVITYPGEVTRFVIRWAETDAPLTTTVPANTYPFTDPELIDGYGYVWHCHIIDHEDNEMMRPYKVGATRQTIQ